MAKRLRHRLGALDVTRAKPKVEGYRLSDGGGLYLYVAPSGLKVWRFRYHRGGKPQTATFGKLSDKQGLAWARAQAEEARGRVEAGDHLTQEKRLKKARRHTASGNTFASVSASWLRSEAKESAWTPAYRDEVEATLINHLSAPGEAAGGR